MKTTLDLDDVLDARLRETARRHGWSLKEALSKALREGLRIVQRKDRSQGPLRLAMAKGRLLVDPCDEEALSEALKPEP
jgi:hypothetical protein